MGMDVYGRGNGEEHYFRANIWSWRPIVEIMERSGVEVPSSWSLNDGEGATCATECRNIARKLRIWLDREENVNEQSFFLDTDYKINGRNPYGVTREHLQEWIAFLDQVDGFEIW